jgi:hypothetical protein
MGQCLISVKSKLKRKTSWILLFPCLLSQHSIRRTITFTWSDSSTGRSYGVMFKQYCSLQVLAGTAINIPRMYFLSPNIFAFLCCQEKPVLYLVPIFLFLSVLISCCITVILAFENRRMHIYIYSHFLVDI